MKTPEEIYLVPSTEPDYDYVWCDDPAPTDGHDASEAVRYVRGDVVEMTSKKMAVDFFRWWYNQPGTNTDQGFDTWWSLRQKAQDLQ